MDISGSHRIPAPRAVVWAALRDPELLRACVPGCERLTQTGDGAFEGVIASKVGPIRTSLAGEAAISGAEAPERFTITAKGADPVGGGGEGSAVVTLEEDGDGTLLGYQGQAEAHGKISQLGQRLLVGVFRRTVETFCEALSARLSDGETPATDTTVDVPEAPPLVHEEPAETATAQVLDAPPLAAGVPGVAPNRPIAPTATPDIPETAGVAASEQIEAETSGASATTRIMLVAAIVVVIGAIVYYMVWQAPGI